MGLEAINVIRKRKGMNLDELATKSGIPIGTLGKISAGITKDPKLETIKSIARALECSLDEFDDNRHPESLSEDENDLLIKYRFLSDSRRLAVKNCLNFEYRNAKESD